MNADTRNDWDIIMRYLVSVAHSDVIVEYNGKRWFYTQPEGLQRGIFMLPERAPIGTPALSEAAITRALAERRAA